MKRVTIGTCSIDDQEISRVTDALKTTMLSNGKYVHEFEETLADFYGKKHGILVNSGQTALELGNQVMYNKGVDHVGVPILSYLATLWSVIAINMNPVFFDIDLKTYGIDLSKQGVSGNSLQLIDPCDLDAVVAVDLFGKKSGIDMDQLTPGTPIMQDCCEAVLNPACKYGDYIALSFYASHIISCGSGGMILLDRDDEADWIRSYIAHGRNHDGDFTKNTDEFMDRFQFDKFGQSLRSDNITAAIGMGQIAKKNMIISKRVKNAQRLSKALADLQTWGLVSLPCFHDNVFMFYPMIVNGIKDGQIIEFMTYLWNHNIDSRRMMPVMTQKAFRDIYPGINPENFPNAKLCEEHGILLGVHQDLTDDQIDYMAEIIKAYWGK